MPSGLPSQRPRILVAPLDWGLGHATRCVPLIRRLLQKNGEVLLGGSGQSGELLQQEFPGLPYLPLPSYNIRYAARPGWLPLRLLAQVPRVLGVIRKEQSILQEVARKHALTAVISDNRFGLRHPALRSVFLTHQLTIAAPFAPAEAALRALNYRFIRRFSEVWVPDGRAALAGRLAVPSGNLHLPVRYVGALSRFEPGAGREEPGAGPPVVVLSGPEPQRTLLENILLPQLERLQIPIVLVRGLPSLPGHGPAAEAAPLPTPGPRHLTILPHLPAHSLLPLLQQAPWVLSRSGYSTVMDLAALRKKAILIPTPGQTEQEYLAAHLQARGLAHCPPQAGFHLPAALAALGRLSPEWPEAAEPAALDAAIDGIFAPS